MLETSIFTGGEIAAQTQGFGRARRNSDPQHKRRVLEAARLIADAISGRIDPFWVREAMNPSSDEMAQIVERQYPGLYPRGNASALRETMSRTDYQALFADVLDILYYGYFSAFPVFNESVCRVKDLTDTRFVKRYLLDGLVSPPTAIDLAAPAAQQALSGPVPQDGATVPEINTAAIEYQPFLLQVKASINWSAILNDNLGIFQDVPKRLVIAINRAIAIFIHGLYMGATDLNTILFQSGYANRILIANGASSNNPPLGAQGIMDGTKILAGQRDSSGQPIMMGGAMVIVYGPSNVAAARNLQNAVRNQVSVEGGSENAQGFPTQWIETNAWFNQNTRWIMDPYIATGAASAGFSSIPGAWLMFVDEQGLERPTLELGYLRGFRQAQLFQKVPNTMRPGGGVEPMMGDWSNMNQEMKAMSVLGGTQIEGRSVVGSTGAGS